MPSDNTNEAAAGRISPTRRDLVKGLTFMTVAGAQRLLGDSASPRAATNSSTAIRSPHVEQWGLQEIALRSDKTYANPFQEVQLQGSFSCDGETVTAQGFFDGDSTWKVRLMPGRQGRWTFTTKSNDVSLNDRTGEFEVVAPGEANHGPVRVSNQFHFSYADGTPFYPLGTTTYQLFHQDREAQIRTVSTLSRTAFNKVRIFVMPFSSMLPGDGPFQRTANSEFDFERYNVDFFRQYEAGLSDLQALGIEADLILFHPYDARGKFSKLERSQDESFIRYTLARLSAYRNVWWTLTNEFDLYPQFGIQKDWAQLGKNLASCDPYGHLRGIHNSCVGFYDNSQNWITHVIFQDITLQRLTAEPRNNSAMGLDARKFGKPVVIDEYGYEGNIAMTWGSIAPREAVEMHWSIVMAGAYGSHGESYFGTPRGTFVGESPERLAFLKKIMTETPFQQLAPLPEVVAERNDSVTVLGAPGICYLFHFDQPKEKASWNLGFFGPATPSRPLPVVNRSVDPNSWAVAAPKFGIVDGLYRVEMIDTWQMKVHPLGFTTGASQQFRSLIEPGVIRLTRVEKVPENQKVLPIAQLLQQHSLF